MTSQASYRALTRAFIRSQLNNKVRLLLAGVGIVAAVNGIYELPLVLSNVSDHTVHIGIVAGADQGLGKDLATVPRVNLRHEADVARARAELATGQVDAAVLPSVTGPPGVTIESAGIFGAMASKTVATAALEHQLRAARTSFAVSEIRDPAHGQFLALFLPCLLAATVLSSAFSLSIGTLGSLRSSGMLQRLKVTGVGPLPLLASMISANLLLTGCVLVLLIASAAAHTATDPSIPALLLTAVLGFVMLSSTGLLLVSRFKNAQNATTTASLLLGALLVPALVPVPNVTNHTAQWLVTASPTGSLSECFRAALHGAQAQPLTEVLPIVAGWAVVTLLLATRLFRWDNQRG